MIVFRADANETVATGHLMRCMTIAEACREKDAECEFWLAEDRETGRLREAGFPYRILGSHWDDLEGELPLLQKQFDELEAQGKKISYLVVDSYQATSGYLGRLRERVPVLYIDDMREQSYPVSAVLQYIPSTEEKPAKQTHRIQKTDKTDKTENADTIYLRGLSYAPLRKEFVKTHCGKREKSILITTGGTDTYHVAGRLLRECVKQDTFREYRFHVIVGSMNSHEADLQELAGQDARICLHKNISNMSDYMRSCKLAVSASGTTLLELCACAIPTVCFSFADNQVEFASCMDRYGAMRYVGDAREKADIEQLICAQLVKLAEEEELQKKQSARMETLVNGKGAERIADFLIGKGL